MTKLEWEVTTQGSLEVAKETARNQLSWLDYVPEGEFLPAEKRRLMNALRRLALVSSSLNAKYVD